MHFEKLLQLLASDLIESKYKDQVFDIVNVSVSHAGEKPVFKFVLNDGVNMMGRTFKKVLVKNQRTFDDKFFTKGYFGEVTGMKYNVAYFITSRKPSENISGLKDIYKELLT